MYRTGQLRQHTATVVGSGPNGLTAAAVLARAGLDVTVFEAASEVGGGARTERDEQWGVLHDICSAIHPFGVLSPVFSDLPLEQYGLEWKWPEIGLAHPLDGGRAAWLEQSIMATATGLGRDGEAWSELFDGTTRDLDPLLDDILRPLLHVPRHPMRLARFGLRALRSADAVSTRFHDEEARALFAGVAAHQFQPPDRAGSAAVALVLAAAAHGRGWPVAAGGSGAITQALAGYLRALGGDVRTDFRVASLAQLPRSDLVLLDVAPAAAVELIGEALPGRVATAFRRWRRGPAAYKVDLVIDDHLPWDAEVCRRAGTVHVGGSAEEIATALRSVVRGEMPERPFVLVGQQYLCDGQRSAGDVHPVWAYAQVPTNYERSALDAILDQIERFAPGTRDRIVDVHVRSPADLERHNENYVGGDISTGATSLWQTVFRPRVTLDPYATGVPGVFLCSAATPPGPGVHGMCGLRAAERALKSLEVGE